MLKRFLRNCEGGAALMASLAMVPLVGSVGAAVDLSRATSLRSNMQAALDASAIAMAKDARNVAAAQLSENANNYFKANFQNAELGNLRTEVAASSTPGGYSVSMSASGSVKTKFMGILGFSSIDVSVRATAVSLMDGLLAFSRSGREEIRKTRVDVRKLVEGLRDEQFRACGPSCCSFQIGELPPAYADPAMLHFIFANLISNA